MAIPALKLTVEQLNSIPDDGRRHEIIDGDLIMSPAPARAHQLVLARLSESVGEARRRSGAFEWFPGPVDVRFSEFNQVQPDLVVLLNGHLDRYQGHTVFGAPDFVVQVISPSSRDYDLETKRNLYRDSGVPEYWIIDTTNRRLDALALRDGQYVAIPAEDATIMSVAVPSLSISLQSLFKGI